MPNEWINEKPTDTGWLDKTPTDTPPLKSLTDIGDDRQKASEAPKPTPEPLPAPEPAEEIPYSKASNAFESASTEVLGAVARLEKASVDLRRISVVVPGAGEKGKALLNKAIGFQSRLESMSMDLKKLSEEIAEYKNSLPKETEGQI